MRPVCRGHLTENSGTTSLPVSSPGRTIDSIEIMPASPAHHMAHCEVRVLQSGLQMGHA